MRALHGSADLAGGRYAAVMAALVALYLLVVVYVYPQDILWLDIAATAAFTAGPVGTCASGTGAGGAPPAWAGPGGIQAGFAVSALLFRLGMALLDLTDSRAAWL